MKEKNPPIFDRMSALADTTRTRLLLLLERQEMTVGELCAALQLPQSTASRHLKVLGDEGWVTSRAEATSRRYRMRSDALDGAARQLWALVRDEASELPTAAEDAGRLKSVLAQRTTRSREFFSSAAGQWDRMRTELFGSGTGAALLALLDPDWTVGDLGCGTGELSARVAPFVGRVVAVDSSPEMLQAARARLAPLPNAEVREGELESLPVGTGELDAAVLSLALTYVAEPGDALREAARTLRPGGRLVLLDLAPHDREDLRETMGQLWPGFSREQVLEWMSGSGLADLRVQRLAPDPAAKGPSLFVATGRRTMQDTTINKEPS